MAFRLHHLVASLALAVALMLLAAVQAVTHNRGAAD